MVAEPANVGSSPHLDMGAHIFLILEFNNVVHLMVGDVPVDNLQNEKDKEQPSYIGVLVL